MGEGGGMWVGVRWGKGRERGGGGGKAAVQLPTKSTGDPLGMEAGGGGLPKQSTDNQGDSIS
jgi:hypothetical protein